MWGLLLNLCPFVKIVGTPLVEIIFYYQAQYVKLEHRFETAKEKMATLQNQREDRLQQAERVTLFMQYLAERDYGQIEFDDRLWLASVEKAVVNADGSIAFWFYGGVEIRK